MKLKEVLEELMDIEEEYGGDLDVYIEYGGDELGFVKVESIEEEEIVVLKKKGEENA